jgi:hypothetical protein
VIPWRPVIRVPRASIPIRHAAPWRATRYLWPAQLLVENYGSARTEAMKFKPCLHINAERGSLREEGALIVCANKFPPARWDQPTPDPAGAGVVIKQLRRPSVLITAATVTTSETMRAGKAEPDGAGQLASSVLPRFARPHPSHH